MKWFHRSGAKDDSAVTMSEDQPPRELVEAETKLKEAKIRLRQTEREADAFASEFRRALGVHR